MLLNKAVISQVYPRLTVYEDENYNGRSRVFRGNVAIRNTDNILDGIESLRFYSPNRPKTLVLFSRTRFRGSFRVFHSNTNIRDLDDYIRGNDVNSIISSNQYLSNDYIRDIIASGNLPSGYRII